MKPFQRIQSLEDYQRVYDYSVSDPEAFWAEIAQSFVWQKPFTQVLNWDFEGPNVRWFEDGVLNITENCLDRHLPQKGNQTAIVFEPNRPEEETRSFTYAELHQAVMNFAQVLLNQGVKKGRCLLSFQSDSGSMGFYTYY